LLIFSLSEINAQCNLPYRVLSTFKNDTTAFMIYNFRDRMDCYKGKTLKEVTDDLKIPIKDFMVLSHRKYANMSRGIYIYIYPKNYADNLADNKKEAHIIEVNWESPIDYKEVASIKKQYEAKGWNFAIYNYFKDMKIREAKVLVLDYSKYYEKYKPEVSDKTPEFNIIW